MIENEITVTLSKGTGLLSEYKVECQWKYDIGYYGEKGLIDLLRIYVIGNPITHQLWADKDYSTILIMFQGPNGFCYNLKIYFPWGTSLEYLKKIDLSIYNLLTSTGNYKLESGFDASHLLVR